MILISSVITGDTTATSAKLLFIRVDQQQWEPCVAGGRVNECVCHSSSARNPFAVETFLKDSGGSSNQVMPSRY